MAPLPPEAVHPRERGEHSFLVRAPPMVTGSSPRARGTRHPARCCRTTARFIPASAGNTSRWLLAFPETPVHPRERGEHAESIRAGHDAYGSSPRARGTPMLAPWRVLTIRFIPASAGNTDGDAVFSMILAVHPRERGEHADSLAHAVLQDGSSPRARGTLLSNLFWG